MDTPVAAGFTPAFKFKQKILLAVFERGHKALDYKGRVRAVIDRPYRKVPAEMERLCRGLYV